ncbi:hypothetical protein AVEN_185796-1 [Araneus ventricosus]|uniref:Uncharacterized protein n=1 Tax=Araneus ventricosus TaxID=182803 RepID=A0A4Y2HIR5_ARAVE|nr:hypothetical protein AVEN_185796-1 [Araneus ventricosus]
MERFRAKENDKALELMFLIVEDTFLDDIGDTVRARDAREALKEMHTKCELLHILRLMKDFFNVIIKPNESMKFYLGRLMDIHMKLSSGGYVFTDREVALIKLNGLPKSYAALIQPFPFSALSTLRRMKQTYQRQW